jgi:hypothetical protein
MKPANETSTRLRRVGAILAAAGALLVVAGCEDDAQGGIGASTTLPSIVTNFGAEQVDVGAGNVQWVGNPRW